jgi:arylsulfatase A
MITRKHPTLALLAALGCSLLCAEASKPNIVFILVDDLGYADTGAYGAKDIRTPHIDRLAREGVKFTDFYASAPVCTPTRTAFLTGRWQQRYGMEWAMGYAGRVFRREGDQMVSDPDIHSAGLPASVPSLPKMLRAAGYVSGAFGKWHLGYRDEFNPLHHGFDEYFGELLGHCDYYNYHYYDGTYALRDGLEPVKAEGYLTDLINQWSADFVARHAGGKRPFFLYIPHLAAHSPYQPPGRPLPSVTRENLDQGSRADYIAMVERVDDGVGMVLRELEKAGVLDDTLIVFSSDNGGAHYADNRPLFNRKTSLWEGGIRVPLLMRWPGKLGRGVETAQVGVTMDLTATFATIAGVPPMPDHPWDGIDLLPLIVDPGRTLPRTLFWRVDSMQRVQKAVRHRQWKYVRDAAVDLLFDLSHDVGERTNLFYQHPEIVAELKGYLAKWEAEMAKERPQYIVR